MVWRVWGLICLLNVISCNTYFQFLSTGFISCRAFSVFEYRTSFMTMLAFACKNGSFLAEEFLEFFKNKDEPCFNNYVRLAKSQGVYEQFKANPLATILTMGSKCCMDYANEFCAVKSTCPFKAGQMLWQRSLCDHDTVFEYQVIKVCKKTVTVKPCWEDRTRRCRIVMAYDNPVPGWSAWRLENESRRIFLNYANRR